MKKFSSAVLIFVSFLLILSFARGVFRLISSRDKIDKARERLSQLQVEKEQLTTKLKEINSDTFKEVQLRDNLGLAREEETVVVLPSEDVLRKLSPRIQKEQLQKEDKPIWQKWVDLFTE